jgi:lysophospholipase L1-like esterase
MIKQVLAAFTAAVVAGYGAVPQTATQQGAVQPKAAAQATAQPGTPPGGRTTIPGPSGSNTVLPLGDSITLGATDPAGCGYRCALEPLVPGGITWVGSMRDDTGRLHDGHSGYRINQLSPIVRGLVAQYRPRVVLVHAGTNDDGLNQNATGQQMLDRMAVLLDEIAAGCPGTTVIVAKIQLTPFNTALQQEQERIFNAGLDALAARKTGPALRVRTVDMAAVAMPTDDRIHPNHAGYAIMAQVWAPAVNKVFSGVSAW